MRPWPVAPCLRDHPFGVIQVEIFWNSLRHGLSRPWRVGQFQLSFLADSRGGPIALGKSLQDMASPFVVRRKKRSADLGYFPEAVVPESFAR